MSRPRRILWSLLKAAATLLVVLGLTLLVAWPFAYSQPGGVDTAWSRWKGGGSIGSWQWPAIEESQGVDIGWDRGRIGIYLSRGKYGRIVIPQDPASDRFTLRSHKLIELSELPSRSLFRGERIFYTGAGTREYGCLVVLPLWLPAALLFLPALLWLALAWRRRRRTQYRLASGLCLHCGYPWRQSSSAACPECGAARPMVEVA